MGRKIIISPSIMCIKPWEIREFIAVFEEKNIDLIHFDVMDGHFVPNIMLGTNIYAAIKEITQIPVDIHLMCEEPEQYIDYFKVGKGDWVSFHPEATRQPYRILQMIRERGCKAGIALNPGTPVQYVEEMKSTLDFILVMAVEPGFAGQKMVPDHLGKLRRIKSIIDGSKMDIEIIVDGNTTIENSKKMLGAGATGFVAGTSSLIKYGAEGFAKAYDEFMEQLGLPKDELVL